MERRLTVEEIAAKLKPIFGKKIDDVYLRYAMAEGREEREEIEAILNALYHKHLSELLEKRVLLSPPPEEDMGGKYPLGKISYAGKKLYDFNLREVDWPRHVCITGMSGSGKTTLAFHIIQNFIEKKKPFLVFDWKKSFRPLVMEDSEIMDFTVGNDAVSNLFKININEPPAGVDAKEWLNTLCDLLTESFMVSFGVHKVLLETLDEAFKEWGIYQGSKNYPTWNHIKWRLEQKMQKSGGREGTWLESALRIASVLTFGNFGKICNFKGEGGMRVEDLLDKKVIFELNTLSNIEKKFFCEFILTYLFKLKKANQNTVEKRFDHAILVDEAHNIFLKEKTHFVKESVTDMVYREMREYGTSLICLDQHISKLSDTVKGNSACHIAFQQQLPEDIRDISGIMQLFEKKEYFSKLVVGQAIVKLAERYTSPFLIEVGLAELRTERVTNSDIKKRMDGVLVQKEIEEGRDEEFREKLEAGGIEEPTMENIIEEITEKREEREKEIDELRKKEGWPKVEEKVVKARIPKHALYDGELEEAKKLNIEKDKEKERKMRAKKGRVMPIIYPTGLTPVQERLLEFVEQQLALGKSMAEIERIMEYYPNEGLFTLEDVSKVINYVLASRFNKIKMEQEIPSPETEAGMAGSELEAEKVGPESIVAAGSSETVGSESIDSEASRLAGSVTPSEKRQKRKVYKAKTPSKPRAKVPIDTTEQERFLAFLQANPDHNLSSVEVYKQVGLSARKGTKVKDQLLELGKIKIIEERSKKGWKKIIRLK